MKTAMLGKNLKILEPIATYVVLDDVFTYTRGCVYTSWQVGCAYQLQVDVGRVSKLHDAEHKKFIV